MGCHENSVYAIIRKSNGGCRRCGAATRAGKTSCDPCLSFDSARIKAKRAERRRSGICVECGNPRSDISQMYCDIHRINALERQQESKARLKNGSAGLFPSQKQKYRSLRWKYGQGGIDAWERDHGACIICDASSSEATIHIHHVDEDQSNNNPANLVCLCFECHNTAHRLKRLRNLPGFIAWFRNTYPVHAI